MELSARIKNLGKYFVEMQIVEQNGINIIYVVVNFPSNWVVDEEYAEKKNVTIMRGETANEYYFSTDIDTGEEVIFDVIDDNIEKMKEAIERAQLLATKTKELKSIFENEEINIEKLRTIRFCFDDDKTDIIITKGKDKDKNKEKEDK